MSTDYTISTDKSQLDLIRIYEFLTHQSYWARDRSLETVQKSIENSLCFGVYQNTELVGFGRVVTDYSVFAWLLDIFIIKEHRGKGLGKLLVEAIITHQDLRLVKRWMLGTQDAHSLYYQYGFRELNEPDLFMEMTRTN
jgi:GNAT superfamily N-acetyltransferase